MITDLSLSTSETVSVPPSTPTSFPIRQTVLQRMPSPSHSIQCWATCRTRRAMWGCSSWTTAQHLTPLFQTCSSPNYWNYRSPSPPATGLETSCQVAHSLWDSAPTTPLHSHSALVTLKAAFWALYCTPCTPMTALHLTQLTALLNMQMTPQWLDETVYRAVVEEHNDWLS